MFRQTPIQTKTAYFCIYLSTKTSNAAPPQIRCPYSSKAVDKKEWQLSVCAWFAAVLQYYHTCLLRLLGAHFGVFLKLCFSPSSRKDFSLSAAHSVKIVFRGVIFRLPHSETTSKMQRFPGKQIGRTVLQGWLASAVNLVRCFLPKPCHPDARIHNKQSPRVISAANLCWSSESLCDWLWTSLLV